MKLLRFVGMVIRDAFWAWVVVGLLLLLLGTSHSFSSALAVVPMAAIVSAGCRMFGAIFGWGRSNQSKTMTDSEERKIMALGDKIARNGLSKAESSTYRCEHCQSASENSSGYYTCGNRGIMVLATQTCDDHSRR